MTVSFSPDPAVDFGGLDPIVPLPRTESLSLFVMAEGQPRLVASQSGHVAVARLAQQAGSWRTTEPFGLGPMAGADGLCRGVGRFTYDSLELTMSGDTVAGKVRGRVELIDHARGGELPFVGTFTGAKDRTPPAVSFRAATPHPSDGVVVMMSEALAPGTTVSLQGPDGRSIPLAADPSTAYPARFATTAALDQGTSYTVVVEPALTDLAGNTSADGGLPTLTTLTVPLIPEDGFEGPTMPLLAGAYLVGAPIAPPISGARSLLFPPRALAMGIMVRFSARLAVNANDRRVRATMRMVLEQRKWRTGNTVLRLVAAGGMPSVIMLPEALDPLTCPNGDLPGHCYSPPVQLDIPLPAGNNTEVLLDVQRQPENCLPQMRPEPGFLLDDLRVE